MNKIIGIYSDDPLQTERMIRDVLREGYKQPVIYTSSDNHTDYTKQFKIERADNVEQAQQLTIKRFGKRADFGVWDGPPLTESQTCDLPVSVAVVITSHNYGRFLAECIESVLDQSRSPNEIIIVDDASSDDTGMIACKYKDRGVDYLRVDCRNVTQARFAGVRITESEIVLFVDADDTLPPDYVECGMNEFIHKKVGVVYADHKHFGNSDYRTNFPAYTQDRLFQGPNFVSTCSFVRRETLLISNAWVSGLDDAFMPEDYWLFQMISLDGWEFRKQKAVLNYRRHNDSMSQTRESMEPDQEYYLANGLRYQTVTLYIALAGRSWMWDKLRDYLERQAWPHNQIKLIFCDTSQDADFTSMVRQWIADSDYTDVRHFQMNAGVAGLADSNRRQRSINHDVKHAVCKIYNQLRLILETPYCWILEDDIIPPDDVLERLLKSFHNKVGAVTAPYQSRYCGEPVVWERDDSKVNRVRMSKPLESGVTPMHGSGFGCLVVRSELVKKHMYPIQSTRQDLDPYFFDSVGKKWERLCDWSCACEHWDEERVYLIGAE